MADADRLMLQHNPLGIRSLDGTDIVVGKAPRHSIGSIQGDDNERTFKGLQAKRSFYESSSDDSIPTGILEDEELEEQNPSPELAVSSESKSSAGLNNVHLDFGGDLTCKLGNNFESQTTPQPLDNTSSEAQDRNTTASASPMPPSESAPAGLSELSQASCTTPLQIQRLKSIRKETKPENTTDGLDENDLADDIERAESLPEDVLEMIAFSPDSPLFDSELVESSDLPAAENCEPDAENCETAAESRASIISGKSLDRPITMLSNWYSRSANVNPLTARRENKDDLADVSPSVTTLSPLSDVEGSAFPENLDALEQESSELLGQHLQNFKFPPSMEESDPVFEEDRGRLFLQINKFVNMIGLPIELPRNPRFTLSLDNGLQTVKTDPVPLSSPDSNRLISADISQEYELTVAKDLELLLTISVTMDAAKPPVRPRAPQISAKKARKIRSKYFSSNSSSIGAVPSVSKSPFECMKKLLLRSPRKKREAKSKGQDLEELQRQLQMEDEADERGRIQHEKDLMEFYNRANVWRSLTGPKGEYCRSYLIESHYEKEIYGKARQFSLPLYNEWDKSTNGVPRSVGELQVTMMYVPRARGSEQLPPSLKQCQLQLENARRKLGFRCEGYLTQQGGDCGNTWRRRYFTLNDTELIGHHDATKKRRSLIHLDRAVSVQDTLSEDLWCIYEDRSFQITFDDGEAIGFYADTIEASDIWIKALQDCIANSTGQNRTWIDLVLEAQESTPA